MSRYRKKIKCLKLWWGAVIAMSPDGKWNGNRFPSLSILGISWWKCGQWDLPAPLSSHNSIFLCNSSWQSNGLFFFLALNCHEYSSHAGSHWWCIGCITALIKTEHIQHLIETFGNVMTSALFCNQPWVHLEKSDPVQPQDSVSSGSWFHCKDCLLHN